jgi:hypothetical protein
MVVVMQSPKRRRSRRQQTVAVTEKPLPTLEETLAYIQAAPAFLHFCEYSGHGFDLWSPHKPMPISIRRALYKHRIDVLTMMHQARACVCVSPQLHRWSWTANEDGIEICLLCREINQSMAG